MNTFKTYITFLAPLTSVFSSFAEGLTIPDGKLCVTVQCNQGQPTYSVTFNGATVIQPSALGLNTNTGDFTQDLTLSKSGKVQKVTDNYRLYNAKQSDIHYEANSQAYTSHRKQGHHGCTFPG